MTTNQTIDGVPLRAIEWAFERLEICQDQAFQTCECEECEQCGKMPDECSGTECAKTCQCSTCDHCSNALAMAELRALLEAPIPFPGYPPVPEDRKLPAAQPQVEQVCVVARWSDWSMLTLEIDGEHRTYVDTGKPEQPQGVSPDVTAFAIQVEKLLCEALGREWAAAGISIESLVSELKDHAGAGGQTQGEPVACFERFARDRCPGVYFGKDANGEYMAADARLVLDFWNAGRRAEQPEPVAAAPINYGALDPVDRLAVCRGEAPALIGSTCNQIREEAGQPINRPCKACGDGACIDR